MNEKILNFAKVSTLAVLLAFGITQVSSWTAPTAVPPNGNVYAPINVGNATQTKAGNLTVGSLTSNGDIDATGDNLINVATPIAPADGVNKAYVDAQAAVGGGGNGGGGDNDFVWGYTDKHYFVSDALYDGNLGGRDGADAKCNSDVNAISGKTYHAYRGSVISPQLVDRVFHAPGVGLYNDELGWVNSTLRIVNLSNTNARYNKNYTGNGSTAKYGAIADILPNSMIRASDLSEKYTTPSAKWFWVINPGPGSQPVKSCKDYTVNTPAEEGGYTSIGAGGIIGKVLTAPIGYQCHRTLNLLCVEN